MSAELPSENWIDQAEEDCDAYAYGQLRTSIRMAEDLKNGTWRPDIQTVEGVLKFANQCLEAEVPKFYPKYQYKLRWVQEVWQIYQDVDNAEKKDDTTTPENPLEGV